MKRNLLLVFCCAVLGGMILWSCQKEVSIETGGNPGGGGTGGGGTGGGGTGGGAGSTYGWSFTAGGKNYGGCVDTAYYMNAGGPKTLTIEGIDTAGNTISIDLVSISGTFATGNYTPANGASLLVSTAAGGNYISITPTAFSISITTINDTLVVGTFTANLSDPIAGGTFSLTNGKVKALIGKTNPCGSSTGGGGSGGGGGGGTGNAVYDLDYSAGTCTSSILGKYWKDTTLNSTHQVKLDVNVTTAGAWNLSTATVNGFKFAGSGSFSTTGFQTITLQGSGKPLAFGSTNFPVTAGSSSCSFDIPVDTVAVAPCSPTNNTVTFSTAGVGPISLYGVTSTSTGGSYSIVGNGTGGDITFEFAGLSQPTAGLYRVQPLGGSFVYGDVRLTMVASSIYWQSSTGYVYVTKANGKVTATFCSIAFSGTLGGPSFNTQASGKVTEQ